MSQNNNDGGAAIGFALVAGAVYLVGLVVFAIVCFISLICTIIALYSLEKPTYFLGYKLFSPDEARVFLGAGVLGAIGLTSFVYFCSFLFKFRIEDEWLFYLLAGGYAFGSVCLS